jgi:hypothetical protein
VIGGLFAAERDVRPKVGVRSLGFRGEVGKCLGL